MNLKSESELMINDYIFMFAFCPFILHLHVFDFILSTNLLTTHNLIFGLPCFYCILLIFPFILFIVPKLCFSKYRRDVERYGSYRFEKYVILF